MKLSLGLPLLLSAISLPVLPSQAQTTKLLLSFQGNCVSNNSSGVLVSRPVTQRTWLQDYATAAGLSSTKNLAAVYHFSSDSRGDSIEIVNATNGVVLDTPFLLYFGQDASLDRTGLTNGAGTQVRIIQYIYTHQSGHSLGAATLSETFTPSRTDGSLRVRITGPMSYLVKPDNAHTLAIFSGTLTTGAPFTPPSPPR